jgi:hypothetical protein
MSVALYEIRKKIHDLKSELNLLGNPTSYIPELITSANLVRSNEYFRKVTKIQSELLFTYAQYSKALEDMIAEIFDIQNDLKNILKEQSTLIMNTKSSRMVDISTKKSTKVGKKSSKK